MNVNYVAEKYLNGKDVVIVVDVEGETIALSKFNFHGTAESYGDEINTSYTNIEVIRIVNVSTMEVMYDRDKSQVSSAVKQANLKLRLKVETERNAKLADAESRLLYPDTTGQ